MGCFLSVSSVLTDQTRHVSWCARLSFPFMLLRLRSTKCCSRERSQDWILHQTQEHSLVLIHIRFSCVSTEDECVEHYPELCWYVKTWQHETAVTAIPEVCFRTMDGSSATFFFNSSHDEALQVFHCQ